MFWQEWHIAIHSSRHLLKEHVLVRWLWILKLYFSLGMRLGGEVNR